jgi:hypothetical protein
VFEFEQLRHHVVADENVPLVGRYAARYVTFRAHEIVQIVQNSAFSYVDDVLLSAKQVANEEAASLRRQTSSASESGQ